MYCLQQTYIGGACSTYGQHEKFRSENLKGRDHMKLTSIGDRIILRWIFRKYGVRAWTGLHWL